jgi:hypothetical protein
MKVKQPMQPLYIDEEGKGRFQKNAIVRYLLDFSGKKGMGLNELSDLPFDDDDFVQFFQLIGYSVEGFGEIGNYAGSETHQKALVEVNKLRRKLK